jgi:hypothetical protein
MRESERKKMEAERIARVAWEANRQLQIADGEDWPDEPWDAAPSERKQLCIATVSLVLEGGVTEPGMTHQFWRVGMEADGWVGGAEKDLGRKQHPSLVPWEELTPRAQLGQRLLVNIAREMAAVDQVVLHCRCERRRQYECQDL